MSAALDQRTRPSTRDWGFLALFLVGTQLAGLIGVPIGDRGDGSWYDRLDKPDFNPPSWVFAPTWTFLYVLIAVAAWLVWRHPDSRQRTMALTIWLVQLVLNALWTPLFFGLEAPLLGFVEILFLLAAIVVTIVRFRRIEATAALLMLPYLAWVAFATVLNATFIGRG